MDREPPNSDMTRFTRDDTCRDIREKKKTEKCAVLRETQVACTDSQLSSLMKQAMGGRSRNIASN